MNWISIFPTTPLDWVEFAIITVIVLFFAVIILCHHIGQKRPKFPYPVGCYIWPNGTINNQGQNFSRDFTGDATNQCDSFSQNYSPLTAPRMNNNINQDNESTRILDAPPSYEEVMQSNPPTYSCVIKY